MSSKLRVFALGGLGEIGKNMTVVEYDGRLVVIDCGLRFPTSEMLGVDLVLPDFTVLKERIKDIEAIIITHGHEDHLGALPWVIREFGADNAPPIYAGELTTAMARSKLDEHKLREVETTVVARGDRIDTGTFNFELVHLTHSIPDSTGVALSCEAGTIFFTGDYKFDQTPVGGKPADIARLSQLGSEGVLLLCGDSTNSDRPGMSVSESTVGPHLEHVFARCKGRIIITSFASNIHRVQQVFDAAAACGRKVALIGRSMRKNVNIGRSLNHIQINDGQLIHAREVENFHDDKLVIISTGSQGEPLSALRRMAYRDHRQVELRRGDTVVFSATPIPGNERGINETIDRLRHIGCDVITAENELIHASGHGNAEEVKLMLNLLRPKYVLPMHGDYRRLLAHADLAKKVGIPEANILVTENGIPLEIDSKGARLGSPLKVGMVFVDGVEIGDVSDVALRDRTTLSAEGIFVVVATISSQNGTPIAPAEVIARGVPFLGPESELLDEFRDTADESLRKAAKKGVQDIEPLEQLLHDYLQSVIFEQLKRRPMIIPVVVEI